jgi:hypothetical protein
MKRFFGFLLSLILIQAFFPQDSTAGPLPRATTRMPQSYVTNRTLRSLERPAFLALALPPNE